MQEFPELMEDEEMMLEDNDILSALFSAGPMYNYTTTEYRILLDSLNSTLENISMENIPGPDFDPIFDFGVPGILLNSVGIFGLFGNLVSIIILSRYALEELNC